MKSINSHGYWALKLAEILDKNPDLIPRYFTREEILKILGGEKEEVRLNGSF